MGAALPGRGDLDRDHVQPVIEILPEASGSDFVFQPLIGRREHPHIHRHRAGRPDPGHHAFLEDPEDLGLGREGHVADLVEEQGSPVGQLELPGPIGKGPGEASFHMAEELALDQLRGNRGAVHFDEGLFPAGRVLVQGAGDQLLAGAVLAPDQHPGVGRADPPDELTHPLERRALPDHRVADIEHPLQLAILHRERGMLEGIPQGDQELVGVEGLLEEVECAPAGRLDRGRDGAVARDHHHGRRRIQLAQPAQGVEPIEAGHLHVEQDHVRPEIRIHGDRLAPGCGGPDFPALVLQHLPKGVPDAAFVVHHQDPINRLGRIHVPRRPP